MMKKRVAAVMLCTAMTMSLAGCGGELSNEYITVKQYKGLEVAQVEKTEVTDSDVENTISSNLSYSAEEIDVTDRAAQLGDTVQIDYVGSIDGVEFDGGTAQDASLELGSGSFIGAEGEYAGFEDQIVGHNIGEEFDITVKFPDNYSGTEVAGKVANFHITLDRIYTIKDAELTDEWVCENSEESKTAEEYTEEIRTQLEEANESSWEQEMQTAVLDSLLEQIEVISLPEDEVNENYTQIEDYYKQIAEMYGVEFEEFLTSYMQMTEEEFTKQATESAETYVKQKLALELIAEKEKLTLTDAEYEEELAKLAADYGYEDDVDGFVEQYGEDTIRQSFTQDKVLSFLVKNCIQVEAE